MAGEARMINKELRAPRKKYFKLEYPTVISVLDSLTDSELGEYFKAICCYELFGEEPESFSDRTVAMSFRMTARELDYQLNKHLRNIEIGKQNNPPKEEKRSGNEGNIRLAEILSEKDIKALETQFQCCSMLIDEVQAQIDLNHTQVDYPRRYIEAYAKKTGWNERIEAEINEVSGVYR